jgi:multiple sugar transport system ATP-binding protein
VREPKAFLMDEPLSNLDAKLRVSMRAELARLLERLGVTTVYVTHDQVEAMTLGERVAVMRDGVLQQVDTPQNLFNHACNLYVAAFIGSPAMNLVEAKIDGGRVHFAGIDLPLPGGSPLAGEQQRRVILGLRPSDFEHAAGADADWARIRVKPDVVEQLGSETLLIFGIDAPPVMADAVRAASEAYSDDDGRLFAGEERAMFTASVDGKRPLGSGEIELAVDFTALHCFDPETGDALAIRRDAEVMPASRGS